MSPMRWYAGIAVVMLLASLSPGTFAEDVDTVTEAGGACSSFVSGNYSGPTWVQPLVDLSFVGAVVLVDLGGIGQGTAFVVYPFHCATGLLSGGQAGDDDGDDEDEKDDGEESNHGSGNSAERPSLPPVLP